MCKKCDQAYKKLKMLYDDSTNPCVLIRDGSIFKNLDYFYLPAPKRSLILWDIGKYPCDVDPSLEELFPFECVAISWVIVMGNIYKFIPSSMDRNPMS